jgi:hypothetical protein
MNRLPPFPRLYTKGVLPVEEAANEEAAEPAELTVGCHLTYGRLERHAPAAGRLDSDLEPFALAEGSADSSDERIPLRICGEVGENFPDPLGRGVDVDLGVELPDRPIISTGRGLSRSLCLGDRLRDRCRRRRQDRLRVKPARRE